MEIIENVFDALKYKYQFKIDGHVHSNNTIVEPIIRKTITYGVKENEIANTIQNAKAKSIEIVPLETSVEKGSTNLTWHQYQELHANECFFLSPQQMRDEWLDGLENTRS